MSLISSDKFSIFSNINGFMSHPAVVSISKIRIYSVYKIYEYLEKWDTKELNKIPDSLVFLSFKADNNMNKLAFKKSCMVEEQVHKHCLVNQTNIYDNCNLNHLYYKYLYIFIQKIDEKRIFKTKPDVINYEESSIYFQLKTLLQAIQREIPSKTNLESDYTLSSYLEEYMMIHDFNINKRTKLELNNIMKIIDLTFNQPETVYNYGDMIIHNGEPLKESFNCIVCADDCTEYADCMYSNCRHMCMCYNCSLKIEDSKKTTCIICKQHNDRIIQVFKP